MNNGEHQKNILDVLIECKQVSFQVLKDLELLYRIISKKEEVFTTDTFLDLLNRREPAKELLDKEISIGDGELFGIKELNSANGFKTTLESVHELIDQYDKKNIPPPYWIRILPACLSIINCDIFEAGNGQPKLGFISFAVEELITGEDKSIATQKKQSYCALLNTRKNKTDLDFGEYQEGSEKDRVRVFAKILYKLNEINSGLNKKFSSPIYWGIKIKTSNKNDIHSNGSYWFDILLSKNDGLPNEITKVNIPDKLKEYENLIFNIIKAWLYGDDKSDKKILNVPSNHISRYSEEIIKRISKSKYSRFSDIDFDTLLIPAVYWTPSPSTIISQNFTGAAASIYWAFEGSLNFEQNFLLMIASQILLNSIAQVTKLSELLSNLEQQKNELDSAKKHIQDIMDKIKPRLRYMFELQEAVNKQKAELERIQAIIDPNYWSNGHELYKKICRDINENVFPRGNHDIGDDNPTDKVIGQEDFNKDLIKLNSDLASYGIVMDDLFPKDGDDYYYTVTLLKTISKRDLPLIWIYRLLKNDHNIENISKYYIRISSSIGIINFLVALNRIIEDNLMQLNLKFNASGFIKLIITIENDHNPDKSLKELDLLLDGINANRDHSEFIKGQTTKIFSILINNGRPDFKSGINRKNQLICTLRYKLGLSIPQNNKSNLTGESFS